MNENALFPIGSVVVLKGSSTPILIYGRLQVAKTNGELLDYIACPYPYGHLDDEHTYMFNHDQIEKLLFIGYQTPEEDSIQKLICRIKTEGFEAVVKDIEDGVL